MRRLAIGFAFAAVGAATGVHAGCGTLEASGGADSSVVDATSDASTDGATDAATDGATDAAAAFDGSRYCADDAGSGIYLCADFDGPELTEGWDDYASAGSGGGGADSDAAFSAPNSFAITAPVTQGPTTGPILSKKFIIGTGVHTVKCSFRFRRDTIGDQDVDVARLVVSTNDANIGLTVETTPTAGRFGITEDPLGPGTGTQKTLDAAMTFSAGEWHLLEVGVTATDYVLLADGVTSASQKRASSGTIQIVSLYLGGVTIPGGITQPWLVRFDNVRCYGSP